mgnify:FL=1
MDYTIKQGDNLSTIAQNNNTDVATLSKLNNIQNPNLIQTGQVIKLGNNTQTNAPTQNLSGNITPAPVSVQDIQKPIAPIEVPVVPVQTQAPVSTNLAQDILNKTAVAETDAQKTARELSTKISALLPSTFGETQALADAKKQYQVNELSKNLNDLNSQILMKQAELNKDDASLAMGIQNIEDKPIAMEFITGQQASVQRQAQIARMAKNAEIGILNARALGLQGNIELATKMAEEAVNLKYAPIKETINLYSAQLKALEPLLSADEKKVAREQEIKTKLAMNEVEQKQANEKKIQELILNASSQGASSGLISKASLAKTPIEVAQILGEFGGKDYLQNQKLRAEIAKINSEIVKNANSSIGVVNGSITAPNGDTINGLPTSYMQAIAKTKLNDSQANAVAFVTRMIQSDKSIKEQLGSIYNKGEGTTNPFFDEVSGYDPTSIGSSFGRVFNSDNARQYDRNAEDFIRAQLRKESGASIAPTELEGGKKLYTSIGAGKDQKDIKEAEIKRDVAIKSMISQAGPASGILLQYYNQVLNGDIVGSDSENVANDIINAKKNVDKTNNNSDLKIFDN